MAIGSVSIHRRDSSIFLRLSTPVMRDYESRGVFPRLRANEARMFKFNAIEAHEVLDDACMRIATLKGVVDRGLKISYRYIQGAVEKFFVPIHDKRDSRYVWATRPDRFDYAPPGELIQAAAEAYRLMERLKIPLAENHN